MRAKLIGTYYYINNIDFCIGHHLNVAALRKAIMNFDICLIVAFNPVYLLCMQQHQANMIKLRNISWTTTENNQAGWT